MKPYSKDLRIRVLAAVDRGVPREEVARTFSVSVPTIKRWLGRRRQTGGVDAIPIPGRPRVKGAALEGWLPEHLENNRDLTLEEHREAFEEESGLKVSASTVGRGRSPGCRAALAAQKKSRVASERDEGLRDLWRWLACRLDARRPVFVDESGFHTSMTRLRARAPKGERAYGKVARKRGRNQTLIASITLQGAMCESISIEGATDAELFEAYVEGFLAPSLSAGQVVVLDGLGAHRRPQRVRDLIEGRGGAGLVFLPPYSPDLNPIEEAFSKIKQLVRKAGARTRDALDKAIGNALSAVTPEDAAGYFAHCGYRAQDQCL